MMWRSAVLILIHRKLDISCEGAVGPRPNRRSVVTLPIEDGHVIVNIDGQDQHLLLDTGSSLLRVMDGDWYVGKYGKGACLTPSKGCFYSPKEAPCDFEKDPTLMTSYSADGSAIK
ncbi:hypothetical protein FOZ62_010444, partial [Perkinsus olseni]